MISQIKSVFHNRQYDSADFEEISPMTTAICEINSQSAKSILGFERRSKALSVKSSGHAQGQSIIELGLLVAMVAAALVAVGVYLQRGYQGYLRNDASSHGTQFDPTRPFNQTQRLNTFAQNQRVDIISGQATVELPGPAEPMTNVPGGSLPGKTLETKVSVTTGWDIQRDARHEAQ